METSNHYNAAKRLERLVGRVQKCNPQHARDGWAEVFGVEDRNKTTRYTEVLSCLKLLREQINEVAARLEDQGHPEHLYENTTNKLLNRTQTERVFDSWSNIRNKITPIHRDVQHWTTVLDDEPEVGVEDLNTLKEELDDFEERILTSDISDRLKSFVRDQIWEIRRTIVRYHVIGVEAFDEGAREVFGNVYSHQDLVPEENGDEERAVMNRLLQYTKRLADWGSRAYTMEKLGADGVGLLEAGMELMDKPL